MAVQGLGGPYQLNGVSYNAGLNSECKEPVIIHDQGGGGKPFT